MSSLKEKGVETQLDSEMSTREEDTCLPCQACSNVCCLRSGAGSPQMVTELVLGIPGSKAYPINNSSERNTGLSRQFKIISEIIPIETDGLL